MSTGGEKKKVFLTPGAEPEVLEDFFSEYERKAQLEPTSKPSEAEWLILRSGECVPYPFIFSRAKNGYSLYRRESPRRRQSVW